MIVPAQDVLWQNYRGGQDAAARSRLLDRYLGLVHHVARQVASRIAASVEVDDLAGAGAIGLMQALETFDLSRGLAFSTYAIRRIRGAILDELRSRDWVPRSVRSKARRVSAARVQLEQRFGRRPGPAELALALSLDLSTYWKWREEIDNAVLVSLDGTVALDRHESVTMEETLADPSLPPADDTLSRAEDVALLRGAIAALPKAERTVLALYYYEDLKLREIAEVLQVSESRVSQIRTQALRRLRTKLQGTLSPA